MLKPTIHESQLERERHNLRKTCDQKVGAAFKSQYRLSSKADSWQY
jgi:hypothetical protein